MHPRPTRRISPQLAQLLLEQIEIDRLADEPRSAKFAGASPPLVVAIGGHHHDLEIREPLLDLAQQLQAVHPRHVNVRENRDQCGLDLASEAIQRLSARGGEMHDVGALAGLAPKALAKEISDIRLIIHNQDAHAHDAASAIVTRWRGNRTVNSVKSPTRLSTSIFPPCCWVTMS